jgi:membrane associated rhomboid family serine protease
VIPIKDNLPNDRAPVVTLGLILANVVLYLIAVGHGGSLWSGPDAHEVLRYGSIPHALTHGPAPSGALTPWQTVFTSMFLHGSFLHLVVNMLFLWIFGNTIEDSTGRLRFLTLYICGGVVALALVVGLEPNSTAAIVGAQGAIAAILGGYTLLYRRARVLAFSLIPFYVTAVEVPIPVMVAAWFVVEAAFGATDVITPLGGGGVVTDVASVGGFLFGLATIKLLAARRKPIPPRLPVY